jgi:hypothetical protein
MTRATGSTRRRLLGAAVAAPVLSRSAGRSAVGSDLPAAVAALRPNESVHVGRASVTGDLNAVARAFDLHRTGPRARNYCLKPVWCPARGTALYLGANHATPHRLNDVWEFDLRALRWTLLYGPDLPRDYKGLGQDASDVLYRNGQLVTRRGGPAIIGHTWSGVTYDRQREQVVFMNAWPADVDAAIQRVGGDSATRDRSLPVWTFDPAQSAWRHLPTPQPAPRAAFGGLLEHVAELGGCIWHMNNWQMRGTWLLERHGRWRNLQAQGAGGPFKVQAPGAEVVGYYDTGRRRLVARQGQATFEFDIEQRRWQRLPDAVAGPAVPPGHAARTAFAYEPRSGGGVLFDTTSRTLWSYRPDMERWHALRPAGPPPPDSDRALCWVDEAAGVVLVVDDTAVWAYRPPA